MERRQVPVKHGNQETYPQFIVQIPRSFLEGGMQPGLVLEPSDLDLADGIYL